MRVISVLFCIIYTNLITVGAFAPSLRYLPTTYTSLCLFGNVFKANEKGEGEKSIGISSSANASFKKQLDGMLKKKKFSVLLICSSAKDCIKEKKLLDEKFVKYMGKIQLLDFLFPLYNRKLATYTCQTHAAVELDNVANAETIRNEFGKGIWIRGNYFTGVNELNALDKKGELDGLLKNVPKTTYTTPR